MRLVQCSIVVLVSIVVDGGLEADVRTVLVWFLFRLCCKRGSFKGWSDASILRNTYFSIFNSRTQLSFTSISMGCGDGGLCLLPVVTSNDGQERDAFQHPPNTSPSRTMKHYHEQEISESSPTSMLGRRPPRRGCSSTVAKREELETWMMDLP